MQSAKNMKLLQVLRILPIDDISKLINLFIKDNH